MDRKSQLTDFGIDVRDLRPRLHGRLIWDGTFHGDTDGAGPIGGGGIDNDF